MFDAFKTKIQKTQGGQIHLRYGGDGPPIVLLHGYPQTHMMWHKVAPVLARDFFVVCPDLRGYGDSSKPESDAAHSVYSKRAMAQDIIDVMESFGHDTFKAAGHDRGARVTHRLALDHPHAVERACVMDIVPTLHMFRHTDQHFATGYYHWFFLIQKGGLPEHLINADPEYYLRMKMGHWSAPDAVFDSEAMAEYIRCFSNPDTVHASCEDYRAAAGIDLEHDEADRSRKVECPLLALSGNRGFVHRTYDVLSVWRDYASDVQGFDLDCGHFLPEEQPEAVSKALLEFFK